MLSIWWDQQEVFHYDLQKPNETVTDDRYKHQFQRLNDELSQKDQV